MSFACNEYYEVSPGQHKKRHVAPRRELAHKNVRKDRGDEDVRMEDAVASKITDHSISLTQDGDSDLEDAPRVGPLQRRRLIVLDDSDEE